jgi:hypothetical protein
MAQVLRATMDEAQSEAFFGIGSGNENGRRDDGLRSVSGLSEQG